NHRCPPPKFQCSPSVQTQMPAVCRRGRRIAILPGDSFWIADNNRGSAKIFDLSGNVTRPGVIGVPAVSGSALPSKPSGIVFNPVAEDFLVRGTSTQFIFATEDGTIST